MHSTNLWHKFNIHWRKITLIFTFLFIQFSVFSQTKVYNRRFLENYDDKEIHFGFYFGTGFSRFDLRHSPNFQANNVVLVTSPSKFSFKVGLVVNRYLNNRWDVRTTPGINITNKEIKYDIFGATTPTTDSRDLDYFEMPVLFKYKSARRKNSRMYMLGGLNLMLDATVRKGAAVAKTNLPSKNADLCLEYGFGFEQFLEFGKIAGELKFSQGLKNLYVSDITKPYRNSLDSFKSHTVTLYLYFE
jgi:Outer membrane protein beta-barrel domain